MGSRWPRRRRGIADDGQAANEERDVAGAIVTPGMIDLHTHVYWGGTSIGVEAEPIARRSGTTTFIDAGTAGPGEFPGFRRHVIEPSPFASSPISTCRSPEYSPSAAP